jgi:hypothetical protein
LRLAPGGSSCGTGVDAFACGEMGEGIGDEEGVMGLCGSEV